MAQRWWPDTCGCVLDEAVAADRSKTLDRVVSKCPAHADVPDAELYDLIYASADSEHKRKNQLEGFLAHHPDFGEDVANPRDGTLARRLRSDLALDWTFTGTGKERVLSAAVRGARLTPQQRQAIRGFIGTRKISLREDEG